MLVLTRKHQEKIRIGENITITILKTKGKTVRLGIEAPAEVPVIRGELSFAGREVEWPADVPLGDAEVPSHRDATSPVDRIQNHWPGKSVPTIESPRIEDAPQVSLQRIPRVGLSRGLPNAGCGTAPLRALLERRSVSA